MKEENRKGKRVRRKEGGNYKGRKEGEMKGKSRKEGGNYKERMEERKSAMNERGGKEEER